MSKPKVLRSPAEPRSQLRPVLRTAGNRARVSKSDESVRTKEQTRKTVKSPVVQLPEPVQDISAGGPCSSDSSSSFTSVSTVNFRQRRRHKNRVKSVKVVPDGVDVSQLLPSPPPSVVAQRRCAWVTPNSDPLYVSFHDEEWGVPVHDDRRLFELLILSEALAELSWPTILSRRDTFRKLFDNFDPASIAKFTENNILSLKSSGCILLSELKLRAIVENAKQMLKVIEEFGSFNRYCWSFVNHKPIINEFRYTRQVPVRTPKAEAISKDLMRRGFRCVGPTIIYSFMQAAGIVNDHLSSCFRYRQCDYSQNKGNIINVEETVTLAKVLDNTCSLQA